MHLELRVNRRASFQSTNSIASPSQINNIVAIVPTLIPLSSLTSHPFSFPEPGHLLPIQLRPAIQLLLQIYAPLQLHERRTEDSYRGGTTASPARPTAGVPDPLAGTPPIAGSAGPNPSYCAQTFPARDGTGQSEGTETAHQNQVCTLKF